MPTRETTGQTWSGLTATCDHCGASHTFTRDQIRRDHEVQIEMTPCHDDECIAMLCESCDQFSCAACGLTHCAEHAVAWEGEKVCRTCYAAIMLGEEAICKW